MDLPFTVEQFREVFVRYNVAVSPAQWLLYGLATGAVALVFVRTRWSKAVVLVILAFLWLWSGLIYHVVFFAATNSAAYFFGALFVLQAALLAWAGLQQQRSSYNGRSYWLRHTGIVLVGSALLIYPILSFVLGHRYPAIPTFGAPCPTTIFTIGILLCLRRRASGRLLVIPLLWSVIALTAAVRLGMYEDYLLLVGIAAGGLAVYSELKRRFAVVVHNRSPIPRAPL